MIEPSLTTVNGPSLTAVGAVLTTVAAAIAATCHSSSPEKPSVR